jgi:hypothetical protein
MRLSPLFLVCLIGCASAFQEKGSAPECYSVGYDLLSGSRAEQPPGTHLVLEQRRARESAEHGWRVARVIRPGPGRETVTARWRASGRDSIDVFHHDGFSGFSLHLRRSGDGLSGTRMLFSDDLKVVQPGVYTVVQDSSAVSLRSGCGAGARPQPGFSDEEVAAIYIAALNGQVRQDPPREAALNRHLMSDAGNYTPSGLMPGSVVDRLRAQGLFSEVCGDGPPGGAGPECVSRRAGHELRLSRPIPRDTNAVDVYIGGGSIWTPNDTTTVFFHVGRTIRCRIVRQEGRWKRQSCETTSRWGRGGGPAAPPPPPPMVV